MLLYRLYRLPADCGSEAIHTVVPLEQLGNAGDVRDELRDQALHRGLEVQRASSASSCSSFRHLFGVRGGRCRVTRPASRTTGTSLRLKQ